VPEKLQRLDKPLSRKSSLETYPKITGCLQPAPAPTFFLPHGNFCIKPHLRMWSFFISGGRGLQMRLAAAGIGAPSTAECSDGPLCLC